VTYSPHAAKFECHTNLGPTGMRAWLRGYHFVVMSIDEGSPAHGKAELADVVIAADGVEFGPEHDPRITLGNAIGRAEADGKPLVLTVRRGSRKRKVRLALPRIGSYSATWPADCGKSDKILDAACRSLLLAQLPSGKIITDADMGTPWGGLLMLGSADATYLDGARRAAYSLVPPEDDSPGKRSIWTMSYSGVLLAEYYLATGDDSVLPGLETLVGYVSEGQMRCGSWGHSSPFGAYGAMNQVGTIATMMLALAQECGIEVDPEVMGKAVKFFARYAELGAVPYGDHFPSARVPDSNGRSASAGVLMHLLGREQEAAAFNASVAMSYWMREDGHTGGYFSMMWGPLSAALAGRDKFRTFMDYQEWYYNLCRTWKGEFVLLPYHEALTRFDDSGYVYFGGDFTTGGLGLAFALPRRHLRILGAPASVFSVKTKLTGALNTAREHYLAREWKRCDAVLAGIRGQDLESADERRWLKQLKSARALCKASTERVLLEVESNLSANAHYRASEQYTALKRCLGDEADPRFEKMDERLDGCSWYVGEGKQYYEAWHKFRGFSIRSWIPQGHQAKHLTEGLPSLHMPIWEPLSPVSDITPQPWRTLLLGQGDEFPAGWQTEAFDDSAWLEHDGIFTRYDAEEGEAHPDGAIAARRVFDVEDPGGASIRVRLRTVRPALTKVYLNGELIVDAVRGQRGGYAVIPLDPGTLKLLRKGKNLLAVTSTRQGKGGNHLDVGLEINRVAVEKRTLSIERPEAFCLDAGTDVDNTLRVRETKDRMQKELRESYSRKSVPELLKELEQPVAFYRDLAVNALFEKGAPGIEAAAGLLSHKDWKVRSSACGVLEKAASTARKDEQEQQDAGAGKVEACIPELIGLLRDPNSWVRIRAAGALSRFGDAATDALPGLLELTQDSDEWVRIAGISAIDALDADAETALAAVTQVLEALGTAYHGPRRALALLNKHPVEDADARLNAIAAMLQIPPEGGGGGRLLRPYLEMAVSLDPDGDVMIPVLIEAAAGKTRLSQQQANPRAKVIELLKDYGDRARPAIPVLEQILASDSKADVSLHEAARDALETLRGKDAETE